MRLQLKEKAPDFSIQDTTGKTHNLEDYLGKKLLISFYRYAACPYCNLRIHQLIQHHEAWSKKGLKILAFFQSNDQRVEKIINKQNVPFPIIADPKHEVYNLYGVESSTLGFLAGFVNPKALLALGKGFWPGKMEGDKCLLPADFLIGPNLRIQDRFYAAEISQHIPISRIESFVNISYNCPTKKQQTMKTG